MTKKDGVVKEKIKATEKLDKSKQIRKETLLSPIILGNLLLKKACILTINKMTLNVNIWCLLVLPKKYTLKKNVWDAIYLI